MKITMSFRSGISFLLLSAFILSLTSGCRDDDGPEYHAATLCDIVEFTSQTATSSMFTLYRQDSAQPVELHSQTPVVDQTKINPGDAVLLAYTPLDCKPYTSGTVDVSGCYAINNSQLKQAEIADIGGWDSDPVYLMSCWCAGGKICFRMRLTYDSTPRRLALIVDKATLSDEYPTAYLYHSRPSGQPGFDRQYYLAVDVAALWSYQSCRGLRVKINNSNLTGETLFTLQNPLQPNP